MLSSPTFGDIGSTMFACFYFVCKFFFPVSAAVQQQKLALPGDMITKTSRQPTDLRHRRNNVLRFCGLKQISVKLETLFNLTNQLTMRVVLSEGYYFGKLGSRCVRQPDQMSCKYEHHFILLFNNLAKLL